MGATTYQFLKGKKFKLKLSRGQTSKISVLGIVKTDLQSDLSFGFRSTQVT